jgi:hypothetical protein
MFRLFLSLGVFGVLALCGVVMNGGGCVLPVEIYNNFKILTTTVFSGLYFKTVQCNIFFKQGSTHPKPVITTPHNARTP